MKFMQKREGNGGFTLIELLVVIAIIGLLASIVLASLNSARKKSRDARRLSDLKQLQNALELYANDNGGNYPSDAVTVAAAGEAADAVTANGLSAKLAPSYIAVIPADPLGVTVVKYRYMTSPAANTAANATNYCVGAVLEGTPPAPASTCQTAINLVGSLNNGAGTAAINYAVGN